MTLRDIELEPIADTTGYVYLHDWEVLHETPKAVCVLVGGGASGWNQKELWLPKSALRAESDHIYIQNVWLSKRFVSYKDLWYLFR